MLDLTPIKERETKATRGPWEARGQMHVWSFCTAHTDCHHVNKVADLAYHAAGGFEQTKADSQFIAHAREDIPALIAEVKRLKAQVERLQGGDDA